MASSTFSGPVTSTNGFVGDVTGDMTGDLTGAVLATTPVNCTASTLTVTQATHGGRVVTLNLAAGITVTLPAASGTGTEYKFVIGTTFTGSGIIQVVGNDTMTGTCLFTQDSADTVVGFETAADTDTITFNGSTTGGLKGTIVELIDVAADLWFVRILGAATGSEATPFSAAV